MKNYLMHYRTPGSKNGYTKYPGKYQPIGEKAQQTAYNKTTEQQFKNTNYTPTGLVTDRPALAVNKYIDSTTSDQRKRHAAIAGAGAASVGMTAYYQRHPEEYREYKRQQAKERVNASQHRSSTTAGPRYTAEDFRTNYGGDGYRINPTDQTGTKIAKTLANLGSSSQNARLNANDQKVAESLANTANRRYQNNLRNAQERRAQEEQGRQSAQRAGAAWRNQSQRIGNSEVMSNRNVSEAQGRAQQMQRREAQRQAMLRSSQAARDAETKRQNLRTGESQVAATRRVMAQHPEVVSDSKEYFKRGPGGFDRRTQARANDARAAVENRRTAESKKAHYQRELEKSKKVSSVRNSRSDVQNAVADAKSDAKRLIKRGKKKVKSLLKKFF